MFLILFLLMSKKNQQTGLKYGLLSHIIKTKQTIISVSDKSSTNKSNKNHRSRQVLKKEQEKKITELKFEGQ